MGITDTDSHDLETLKDITQKKYLKIVYWGGKRTFLEHLT